MSPRTVSTIRISRPAGPSSATAMKSVISATPADARRVAQIELLLPGAVERGSDPEAAASLAVEQRREHRWRIELGTAQEVDGRTAANERDRPQVTDDAIALDGGMHCCRRDASWPVELQDRDVVVGRSPNTARCRRVPAGSIA